MSDESVQKDEPLDALPVEPPPKPRPVCWHCGSDDILRGLKLRVGTEAGEVGIEYLATGRFLGVALTGVEPLRVSLCNQCGTIVRFSVQDLDHEWVRARK